VCGEHLLNSVTYLLLVLFVIGDGGWLALTLVSGFFFQELCDISQIQIREVKWLGGAFPFGVGFRFSLGVRGGFEEPGLSLVHFYDSNN
jgi:hypothetical protein